MRTGPAPLAVVSSLLVLVLALACTGRDRHVVPGPEPATARFEEAPCPFDADAEVLEQFRCGYLVVPENRAAPEGRQLRLAVAVLSSASADPRPDPVVYIPGGPGSSAVDRAPGAVRSRMRAERDLVFFDPRGTGESDPRVCAELNLEWERLTWMAGLDADGRRQARLAALERCRAELEREGVDLAQYHSVANARDLDDLRRALGYDAWNLWGLSYGSRVALEVMRTAPAGVRSVILDGPLPPNAPRWADERRTFADVLRRLLERCAADPACDTAFPGPEARFWSVVEALDREPFVVPTGGRGGLPDPLTVDAAAFAGGVLSALYSGRRSGLVPLLTDQIGSRNARFALGMAPQLRRSPERSTTWVNLTVNCYEKLPFRDLESTVPRHDRGEAVLEGIGLGSDAALCEAWHPYRAGPEQGEPVESAIPTLIFTGEFDPATHRSYGPLAARTLTAATVVEIPGAGHVEAYANPCTQAMMLAFLDDPTRAPDTRCLASAPAPRFITDPAALLGPGVRP